MERLWPIVRCYDYSLKTAPKLFRLFTKQLGELQDDMR